MSEPFRNIAAVVDLLNDHGIPVVEAYHDHDYRDGTPAVRFELVVEVPSHEIAEYAEVCDE